MSEKRDLENDLGHAVRMTRFELTEALGYWGRLAQELEAENARLREQLEQAQAEAAAMREALAPFANVEIDPGVPDHLTFYVIGQTDYKPLTVKDVRNARQALSTSAGREYAERVRKLEAALRGLLLSADCSWEERGEGHDWQEACEAARKLLRGDDDK